MPTIKITTTQNINIEYEVANFSDRIAARLIDYFLFMIVYSISITIVALFIRDNYGQQGNETVGIITIVIWLALSVFYDLICELFLNGQSFGKRSLKIKVISLNGGRPTVGQYLLRWVFRIIDMGLSLGAAAVLCVAFTDNKQRIGDLVAGTSVVKTTPSHNFDNLVFGPPPEDYQSIFAEVTQLTDKDIVLIHDVVKNFNRTRNSLLVYKLAIKIKSFLNITYPSNINEYQFLEMILNDYNHFVGNTQYN
ncbi:RDD family protein [Mucilaginibacter sp. RB4R14]|uniref:RDD family protein n=1 Tax=Mucilaginibacter aurantiaciroseus TaxID=2949308 RepID=UPI0020916D0E|nr:RDD family protein [Mucilaginibacter aurantiaciroseus]MCO5937345.1 RDD family protein [Mucilaginibacter aurantiaciroseus]